MSTADQLGQLLEVLRSHLLPRLPPSALQGMSHTCVATRTAVHSLAGCDLLQLAEVGPTLCHLELCAPMATDITGPL